MKTSRSYRQRITTALAAALLTACGASTPQVSEPSPTPVAEPQPAPAVLEMTPLTVDLDTVTAGRFDQGKMWTFEYPPLDYFRETYGFAPDSSWFASARLGALRIPGCSASFVSPHGLVLTNHHCARESVAEVSRPGERLVDIGFYASSLAEERPAESMHADQLIDIVDVTDEIQAALAQATSDAERQQALARAEGAASERIAQEYGGDEDDIIVEIISLWNGARYSAYVFRRYTDLRLVMAPELQIGFFGGDPDNFTYPRYNLDMSFFRVYDATGEPLQSDNYFAWDEDGVEAGDAVFVIGNPGSSHRLQTVAQLAYRREVEDKVVLNLYSTRADALEAFAQEAPELAESLDVENEIFSFRNAEKAYRGMWKGLHDPVIMAKRRDAERRFKEAIDSDSALAAEFSGLIERMTGIQERKLKLGSEFGAFIAIDNPNFSSTYMLRSLYGYVYLMQRRAGAPDAALSGLKTQMLSFEDQPLPLQQHLLVARLRDFERYLGPDSRAVRSILEGRSPEEAAEAMLAGSVLTDSAATADALASDALTLEDPGIEMAGTFFNRFVDYQRTLQTLSQEEASVARALGRARFHVYGTDIPPDATFSLRIADGVVKGYEYNGTHAPVYTTFYGLYDHFYSYGPGTPWDLPPTWLSPPAGFDLSTPLNFVFTADIIGGNSGSPVINPQLEVVGVVFDGNIESLPGDYIYDPEENRAVAVDARGILEALDDVYDADRIVLELTAGRLVPDEAAADALRANR